MQTKTFKTAAEAYEYGILTKGWDAKQKGKFGSQKRLYAPKATPEGRDVFCVNHSNIGLGHKGEWKNMFKNYRNTLTMEDVYGKPHKKEIGLEIEVIAYDYNKKAYIYLGVYEVVDEGAFNVVVLKKK